ncbi:MAG TPA: hypothetical protein VNG33_07875 [Polyangiaceae bacterium]|nr:hypothetical protein [Polyangiaceae bacterium]
MPDPISSSSAYQSSSADYDPTLDEAGKVCRSDAQSGPPAQLVASTPPAVTLLVSSVSAPASALPPVSKSPTPSTANNNAQRTTELSGLGPYASAGPTGAGDAVYAGVALLKGRDAKSGLEVEVLSASAQRGFQEEFQAGLIRLGRSPGGGSVNLESFTVRANGGCHNDDGSTGLNVGALATALGAEVTVGGANSVTLGLAAGAGEAGSIGVRDVDHDGNREVCIKATFDVLTLGACVETPL